MKFISKVHEWFSSLGWQAADFQEETWRAISNGMDGLVVAPTGSGKTYSILLGAIADYMDVQTSGKTEGLIILWVTPIRALAKEIKLSCERAIEGLGLKWTVGIRSGDTAGKERQNQLRNPPNILITTPESIHIIFSGKNYVNFFSNLYMIVADEWHELMGSKRGVQLELAISRLIHISPNLKIWGISATIGNLEEAAHVLFGFHNNRNRIIIKSNIEKKIETITLVPDEVEKYPWAGHLGLKMADKVVEVISKSKSCLIFTNTRAQCEIWYQKLLELEPDLAGQLAMHHGSISRELRDWVEDALYEGTIKAVVCTSSLDLGVDFRPVDTIIQIGSPKGVARFMQRAGRSGHQPGAVSTIYFLPTHALEILESSALKEAIKQHWVESRTPYIRSFDVLIQYLMTLAVGEGFIAKDIYKEVAGTFCFQSLDESEWNQLINHIVYGSKSLQAYDEFRKVEKIGDRLIVTSKGLAQRHRMSIGTIVSDSVLNVSYLKGKRLGAVEEWFISQLKPGDVFWFAGRALELHSVKDMLAYVKNSTKNTGRIPAYMGGRLPLSSELATMFRNKLNDYIKFGVLDSDMEVLIPLLELQNKKSALPDHENFLVEYFEDREGYHLLMYPFEGRSVHEGMAALIANRIAKQLPISFSLAMNDYGFELLSDREIPLETIVNKSLFSTQNLFEDIKDSINAVEMARRRFRDIAIISGLIFTGYPGKLKKNKHLQSSSQLIFEVFKEYEPDNLLYLQTYEEVRYFLLEEHRLRNALHRISGLNIKLQQTDKATPFAFPIIVDRLRESMSTESLDDRIRKMTLELNA